MLLPTPHSDEVQEFKDMYYNRYGVELTDTEAVEMYCKRIIGYAGQKEQELPYPPFL